MTQGSTDRAVALHSTLFTAQPFLVRSSLNFGSDLRTRILLFATNLSFLSGETKAAVSVEATDSRGISYDLTVEDVIKIPNYPSITAVTIILPDDPSINGDLLVRLGIHGVLSNTVRVGIRAP
jgi:hypothetical protein